MTDWYRQREKVASLAMDDRAIHYGDGLFETIAIRSGQPRLWELHMERLSAGCSRLGLRQPDTEAIRATLQHALDSAHVDANYALAKVIITAGQGPRGYQRRSSPQDEWPESEPLIGVFSARPLAPKLYNDGVNVVQCKTVIGTQPALAGLKTLNRLEQVLARNEWSDASIFEGLMCDTDDHVICGTMSNVFILRDKQILTPTLDRCGVAGVMRRHIIDTLRAAGHTLREDNISMADAKQSEAMFLCNSQFGLLPVRKLADREFNTHSLLQRIAEQLAASGIDESRA